MNNRQRGPEFVRELPDDTVVQLSVEKVIPKHEQDMTFALECRICDGEHIGKMISLLFFRYKKSGDFRKDTQNLIRALAPGRTDFVPSYDLLGKIFSCRPWHSESYKYQMYSDFKLLGENDAAF